MPCQVSERRFDGRLLTRSVCSQESSRRRNDSRSFLLFLRAIPLSSVTLAASIVSFFGCSLSPSRRGQRSSASCAIGVAGRGCSAGTLQTARYLAESDRHSRRHRRDARPDQPTGRTRRASGGPKDPAITRLRVDVADLLDANGGVMTVGELAQTLVTKRGSVQDEPHRTRFTLAVARAALETERDAADHDSRSAERAKPC